MSSPFPLPLYGEYGRIMPGLKPWDEPKRSAGAPMHEEYMASGAGAGPRGRRAAARCRSAASSSAAGRDRRPRAATAGRRSSLPPRTPRWKPSRWRMRRSARGGWTTAHSMSRSSPVPCAPGAILNARIPRVYYGARDRAMGACGGVLNLYMEPFAPSPPRSSAASSRTSAAQCWRISSAAYGRTSYHNFYLI